MNSDLFNLLGMINIDFLKINPDEIEKSNDSKVYSALVEIKVLCLKMLNEDDIEGKNAFNARYCEVVSSLSIEEQEELAECIYGIIGEKVDFTKSKQKVKK